MKSLTLILILVLQTGLVLPAVSQDDPLIQGGVLDLRGYSINKDFSIKLDGEWEFYWDNYLYPDDFQAGKHPQADCLTEVPSYWGNYQIDGKNLTGFGHGTYRLLILLPEGYRNILAFDIPGFDVSCTMYIDNKLAVSAGETGTSKYNSKGGYKPLVTGYKPVTDSINILIQVSNYQHRRGGFWKSIKIGDPRKINKLADEYAFVSYLSLGVLFAFAVFFFLFFLLFKEDKVLLFFAITLSGIFLRFVTTDLYPILIFTNISWMWMIRLEYLGTFIAFIFGMWYFHSIYPSKAFKYFAIVNTALSSVAVILVTFFSVFVFSHTMLYFQPAVLIFILWFVIAGFIKLFKPFPGKWAYFAGSVVFILALVNDIMLANSKTALSHDYIIHFAIQVFVFIQAVLLIKKWIVAYYEKEKLHTEITHLNKNLETIVRKRTSQLESQNLEINKQKEKIENQNKKLQESLDFKNKFFSIIAHDLKSPISSLVQAWELMDEDLPEKEKEELMTSTKGLVKSAADLIDNLLYWGLSQGDQIHYNPENIMLREIIDGSVSLFSKSAHQKSIKLKILCEKNCSAYIDRELFQIVLRNLISNAIKFTNPHGTVSIKGGPDKENTSATIISIEDNGLGMSRETIKNIFDNKDIISTSGTANERGTGLGLRLCIELIKINQSKINIESTPGKGTTISLQLPGKSN